MPIASAFSVSVFNFVFTLPGFQPNIARFIISRGDIMIEHDVRMLACLRACGRACVRACVRAYVLRR